MENCAIYIIKQDKEEKYNHTYLDKITVKSLHIFTAIIIALKGKKHFYATFAPLIFYLYFQH